MLILGLIIGVSSLILLGILVTDGRYGGKWLVYHIYNRWGPLIYATQQEERWATLPPLLHPSPAAQILDVGTATGGADCALAAGLVPPGCVTGIDWSPALIAAATARAAQQGLTDRTHFCVHDLRQPLPWPAQTFALILALEVVETLPHTAQVVAELVRVLAPHGLLVFSVYRGGLAWTAARSTSWYQQQLLRQRPFTFTRIAYRPAYDLLLAQATPPH